MDPIKKASVQYLFLDMCSSRFATPFLTAPITVGLFPPFQDAEFSIGSSAKMGVAFWYPIDSQPWDGAQHFIISCDWVPLDINPAGWSYTTTGQQLSSTTVAAISGLALLLSLAAVMVVIVVGWWVRANSRQFVSLDS